MIGDVLVAAAAIVATLVLLIRGRKSRRTLPPGPRPLPLIGNLLDMPKTQAWLTYRAWTQQYGDVVYVEALGQSVVILGSAAAVNDLFEQRSAIYSDRPVMPMVELYVTVSITDAANELTRAASQHEGRLGDRPTTLRRCLAEKRKLMYSHMNPGAVARYHPVLATSAHRFARSIPTADMSPEGLHSAVSLYLGQTLIKAMYGIDVENAQSDFIRLPQKLVENFTLISIPGNFMVDVFPFLKYVPAWFPGANFKHFIQKQHATQRRALDEPIKHVQAEMARGTAPPSMVRRMLEEDPDQSYLEDIKDVAGLAYMAGNDTTGSVVLAFFLAMLINPDVQAKAQAEVDRVVGKDRLPEFSDEKELPYVQAVINECLRWLPAGPTGVPHQSARDDEYKGYLIPKGSIVIGLAWCILHNTDDYPEPERFKPERFLTPEGKLDPSVRDPRTVAFGSGRRICPGQLVANAALFMTVATLLATVDIVRAKDANGLEIVPEVAVTNEMVSRAKPFPWAARSRGAEAAALLASAMAE